MKNPAFCKTSSSSSSNELIEMTKNKIDEINAAVEEVASSIGNEERIFELGIELGKHLAATKENFERLEFFIRREEDGARDERIREKRKKIDNLISRLFYMACTKQIEINGSVEFDADKYWREGSNLFDVQVVEKFGVQCKSVTQEDDDQDFNIEYEVVGKIGEIFEKYEARKSISVTVHNLNAVSKLMISNSQELYEALGASWISFHSGAVTHDEKRLEEFMEELNKETLLIQLQYSSA